MGIFEINYLAVLVAAIAGFSVGSVWYGPLFGKMWQTEMGFTKENPPEDKHPAKTLAIAFICTFVMSFMIAHLMSDHFEGWIGGVHLGGELAIGFSVTAIGIHYLFQKRSLKLWIIDSAYLTFILILMSVIIAIWPK